MQRAACSLRLATGAGSAPLDDGPPQAARDGPQGAEEAALDEVGGARERRDAHRCRVPTTAAGQPLKPVSFLIRQPPGLVLAVARATSPAGAAQRKVAARQ